MTGRVGRFPSRVPFNSTHYRLLRGAATVQHSRSVRTSCGLASVSDELRRWPAAVVILSASTVTEACACSDRAGEQSGNRLASTANAPWHARTAISTKSTTAASKLVDPSAAGLGSALARTSSTGPTRSRQPWSLRPDCHPCGRCTDCRPGCRSCRPCRPSRSGSGAEHCAGAVAPT
jgi:hypothetical protein